MPVEHVVWGVVLVMYVMMSWELLCEPTSKLIKAILNSKLNRVWRVILCMHVCLMMAVIPACFALIAYGLFLK